MSFVVFDFYLEVSLKVFLSCFFSFLFLIVTSVFSYINFDVMSPYAVLIDYDSGKILYEKQADVPVPPSSMSKLLTLYMLFEKLQSSKYDLNTEFVVGKEAWRKAKSMNANSGSTMFLEYGEKVKVEDLVRGIIVNSGNDATVVVAENISGSEDKFAGELNNLAKRLGLNNTNITNASGWYSKLHLMSVSDIAKLSRKLIQDFPEYYHYFKEKEFLYKPHLTGNKDNRNKLLWIMPSSDGLKTGHTTQGGYGLAASAVSGKRRMIAVVNGIKGGYNPSYARFVDVKKMMEWGFKEFKNLVYFNAFDKIAEVPVWFGDKNIVNVGSKLPVLLTVKSNENPNIEMLISYKSPVLVPIKKGDVLGKLTFYENGIKISEYDLVSLDEVKKASIFGKIFKNIRQLFLDLIGK